MNEGVRDAAIDSVIAVLTVVIEDAHELVVAAWPSSASRGHERIDQLVATGQEFVTLCETLKVVLIRSEKIES